ncbi:MAG: response regulator transcription factor [Thermohalobaculum sp.]|nr:response regulator transcription factor [Thermohalobaculum sp.]
MQGHILIVDDDRQLTAFLQRFLEKQGFHVVTAASAGQMRGPMVRHDFCLIVLDLNLPDADGFEVARELRRSARTPLIMLTARDDVYDRIIGLELGADDYVTKPFEPRELLARIKAVLRRSQPAETRADAALPAARQLVFAGLSLDLVARRLTRLSDGATVALTSTEFALLRALAERAGEVLSRARILETVYGNASTITDRAIDAHVARLRRKLDAGGTEISPIQTIHGEGYILAAAVEPR